VWKVNVIEVFPFQFMTSNTFLASAIRISQRKKLNCPFSQKWKFPIGGNVTKVPSPSQWLIMSMSWHVLWLVTVVIAEKWCDLICETSCQDLSSAQQKLEGPLDFGFLPY